MPSMLPRRPCLDFLWGDAWLVVVALELTSWSWPRLACGQCDSRGRDVGCAQYVVSTPVARTCYDHDCVRQWLYPSHQEDTISNLYLQGDFNEYGHRTDAIEHLWHHQCGRDHHCCGLHPFHWYPWDGHGEVHLHPFQLQCSVLAEVHPRL